MGCVSGLCSVVLLVIQVAGAGGTFPVELTPDAFGVLNPLMPFTYAINAVREAVGGIYAPNLIRDLIAMTLFIPVGVMIGMLLKHRFKKINTYFEKKLEETDLII